jgi:membrane protease YdiL (CAAX protease family)
MRSQRGLQGLPRSTRVRLSLDPALVLYFLITFASSWALWFTSGVLDYRDRLPPLDHGWLIAQIGVFCPSLVALVFTAILRPDRRRQCLLVLLGIYLPAGLLGLAVAGHGVDDPSELPIAVRMVIPLAAISLTCGVVLPRRMLLVRRDDLSRSTLGWCLAAALQLPLFFLVSWFIVNLSTGEFTVGALSPSLLSALPNVVVVCSFDLVLGGALGEELGWRGFALPRLLERMGPRRSALLLGLFWSAWHAPIDMTAGFGAAGVAGLLFRLLFTIALSVTVTWYFIHSGHGLFAALAVHATINWLPAMEFSGYEAAMAGMFFLMLLFALSVALSPRAFNGLPAGKPRTETGDD